VARSDCGLDGATWWMPAWLERRLPRLHIERPDSDDEPPWAAGTQAERERQTVAG